MYRSDIRRKVGRLPRSREIDKAQRVFLLLAHLISDGVAELLSDILLGLGIEVG